jgi:hypothetical protein
MPRPKVQWTDEQIDRLGMEPDLAIARDMGVSYSAVRTKRVSLGIALCSKTRRVNWEKYGPLLGMMKDKELAKKLGCTLNTVFVQRKKRGIPPFYQVPDVDWNDWDDQLGKVPDEEIAEAIGRQVSCVVARRRELRILRIIPKPEEQPWFEDLGIITDSEISRRTGLSKQRICQIRQKHGIPSNRQQRRDFIDEDRVVALMKECHSNDEILADTGVSRSRLATLRREYRLSAPRKVRRPPLVIGEHVDELGTIPDAAFAEKYGTNHAYPDVEHVGRFLAAELTSWVFPRPSV